MIATVWRLLEEAVRYRPLAGKLVSSELVDDETVHSAYEPA
jgi:hypothetical protein